MWKEKMFQILNMGLKNESFKIQLKISSYFEDINKTQSKYQEVERVLCW